MTNTPYLVNPEHLVFALGLVCYPEGKNLRVLEAEAEEHPQRDMLDGQTGSYRYRGRNIGHSYY